MKSFYWLKLLFFLCFLLVSGCRKEVIQEPQFNSLEEELDYLVEKYVKMGAAVGIIDTQQKLDEYYFGTLSKDMLKHPDRHSIFEIGSITKTFTTTILAQMILTLHILPAMYTII